MPTYEYRCRKCHELFDRKEGVREHSHVHPKCPRHLSAPLFSTVWLRGSRLLCCNLRPALTAWQPAMLKLLAHSTPLMRGCR
ncbi:FmdB family zinc ribbon protein [Arhodomonas sp. AD133]|uniref:FmdB family zinc ribbon protein n=1 Tax=Arhodomonas sp. AD133 TaxID=3415009 RepID=UPI003EB92848